MKVLVVLLTAALVVGGLSAPPVCKAGTYDQPKDATSFTQTFGDVGASCGLCPKDDKTPPDFNVASCRGWYDPNAPTTVCDNVGFTCVLADRSKKGGDACTANGECVSNVCKDKKCLELKTPDAKVGDPCAQVVASDSVTNPICVEGSRCDPTGKCVALVKDGDKCTTDTDCASGLCVGAVCKTAYTVAVDQDCNGWTDCQPGFICTAASAAAAKGKCVALYSLKTGDKTDFQEACSVDAPFSNGACGAAPTKDTDCVCECSFHAGPQLFDAVPYCNSNPVGVCNPGFCDCGAKKCNVSVTQDIASLNNCQSKASKAAQDAIKNKGYPAYIRQSAIDSATGQANKQAKQAAFDLHCCQGAAVAARTGTPADQFPACAAPPPPVPPKVTCEPGSYAQGKDCEGFKFTYPKANEPCGLCPNKDDKGKVTTVDVARCVGVFDPKAPNAQCRKPNDNYVCSLADHSAEAKAACDYDDQCKSNSCNKPEKKCRDLVIEDAAEGKACVALGGTPDTNDTHAVYKVCAAGFACIANVCKKLVKDGETCTTDDECNSVLCANGKCAASFTVENNGECYRSLQCKRGYGCNATDGKTAGRCAQYRSGPAGFKSQNADLCSSAAILNIGDECGPVPAPQPDQACECTCTSTADAPNPSCDRNGGCGMASCDCEKKKCRAPFTSGQLKTADECDRKRLTSTADLAVIDQRSRILNAINGQDVQKQKELREESACCMPEELAVLSDSPCLSRTSSSGGLGSGAIAGIIIGAIAGALLLVAIVVGLYMKFGRRSGYEAAGKGTSY